MLAGTLTNLAAVKEWLNITSATTTSDQLLQRLIKGASSFLVNYMNRDEIGRVDHQNVLFDGYGNNFIVIRDWPVIEVSSVYIGSTPVPKASGTPPTNGWFLDNSPRSAPQKISLLNGGIFPRARSCIMMSYSSGYFVADEVHQVPSSGTYKLLTDEFWYQEYSVKLANGTALTYTKSASPATLQYTVDKNTGEYVFNSAQAGATVYISYSYVPDDIVQGTIEIVGERFKAKDRIGYNSKSLGGQETVSYNNQSMSNHVRELINPFRRVF